MNDQKIISARLKYELEYGLETLKGASQSTEDIECWHKFLPEFNSVSNLIIELGTGNGVFTRWLVEHFKGSVISFDYQAHSLKTGATFIQADIFKEPQKVIDEIKYCCSERMLLFCDNGNKPREVEIFSPYLRSCDYLAVHDWNVEISTEDIPDEMEEILQYGLTAFFQKQKSLDK